MAVLLLNTINDVTFLGINLINVEDFADLVIRFFFNTLVCFILIRLLYYKRSRRKDYLFTYFLITTIVFLLCCLLGNVKLQLGFALGLFAVFGILRYRTNPIPIKEMTYLFVLIGISVINALANKKISVAELFFTNFALVFITWGLEFVWLSRTESRKLVIYEKIENIKPENRTRLIEDLQIRLGVKINRVDVGRVDLMKDAAQVIVYYVKADNLPNLADDLYGGGGDDDD
ncbi:MAG: DUF4956 domain-containing protein [Bacteroidota bacterium]